MSPKVASALYSYVEGHYTPWKMLRRRHDDRSRYLIKNISRPTFVEGEQGRFWKGKSSLLRQRTAPGCLEDRIKAKWRFMKILDSENHRHVRNFWSQTGI